LLGVLGLALVVVEDVRPVAFAEAEVSATGQY
jgi:hypothetical protein